MTRVFITRTGVKYHASQTCSSFDSAEQEHRRPIERFTRDLKGLTHDPCSVCWPLESGHDAWRQLELEVERTGDSPYEALFVSKVLRAVPGLRPADVSTQRKAHGRSGDTYYLDFVLAPSGRHQLAVEIDGHDKDPGGKSPAEVQRDVEKKRADLIEAGWSVLNFRNERVANNSDQCVSEIRAQLQDAVSARGRNQNAPARSREATEAAADTGPHRLNSRWVVAGLALAAAAAYVGLQLIGADPDPAPPAGGECSAETPVKGNISQDGERIYHQPGWTFYERTGAEACFSSGEEAEAAGHRASEVK